MSGTSTPLSPSSPPAAPTRTLAIIKPHALRHRITIEPRILEAGFEIIKERQMQFHPQGDREALEELFGKDVDSLTEDPVWVYVLERRRAVEVWNTLMGHEDPEQARIQSPNSLRAVFGEDLHHNGFIGSPDSAMAEMQIATLFASSPPFPTADLPDDGFNPGSVRSVGSSVASALRRAGSEDRSVNGSVTKPGFKARPLPSTTLNPTSVPRMTKAAALRQGIAPPTTTRRMTEEEKAKTFVNVPGHKRSSVIAVASTAAPTIAPRPTRASALRTGQPAPSPPKPRMSLDPARPTFEGVPGHKRASIGFVVKAPTIAPRANRAAELRASGGSAPTTPTKKPLLKETKEPKREPKDPKATFEGVPGHKRAETIEVASVKAPTVAPRANRSSMLRSKDTTAAPPSSFMFKLPVRRPSLSTKSSSTTLNEDASPTLQRSHSSASIRSAATPRAPDIAPRTNRSALLRAAKMGAPEATKKGVFA